MEEVRIACGHVYLRPIAEADTDLIVAWRNDPSVRDRFVFRETFTRQMHEAWLRDRVATGQVVQFMICESETARPVGSVYLRDIDHEAKRAEYGIFIGEASARGRGYATAVAGPVVRYAFDTLDLTCVGLRVYTDNEPALAGYRHAGFRVVKRLHDVTATDGTKADMYWMEVRAGDARRE